jgi:Flp pilus assembly protein TadD
VTSFVTLNISATESYLDILAGDFVAARKACEPESSNPDDDRSRQVALAVIHLLANDVDSARNEIEKTHALVEARVHERPDDNFTLIQSAWINLALGNNAEALRLATRAAELSPIEKDALATPAVLDALAQIQARAGEPAGAVKTLQRLLAIPAGLDVSIARLRVDPIWDTIRNDPGFQKLLAGKELVRPNK